MEIIPAIDIRGGRCVRLVQGDYDRETVFAEDPSQVARRWVAEGARRLHVVDLDGAREGRPVNREAIERIVAAVDAPVQLGGGMRDIETVEEYLTASVERVVLGTAALEDKALVREAVERFPGRIVGGVDARDGVVVTEGWLKVSELGAIDLARRLARLGVERIVYTDTLRDGTMTSPNFKALAELLSEASISSLSVVYSGGVSTVEHVRRLAHTGIEGVIIGRALYTGDIELREAIVAAD